MLFTLVLTCIILTMARADDWLIKKVTSPTTINDKACWNNYGQQLCGIEMSNKLLSKRFVITKQGTFGSIDFILNATHKHGGIQSMFRAITPEAHVTIDAIKYSIGGLNESKGDGWRGYRNNTGFASRIGASTSNTTFRYTTHRISKPVAPFPWTPGFRHGLSDVSWPPKGLTLAVDFKCTLLPNLTVTVYYEMYDGIPLMTKWMTMTSTSTKDVILNSVTVDLFAANARFGAYLSHGSLHPNSDTSSPLQNQVAPPPLLNVKSDQAHGAECIWRDDFPNSQDDIPKCPTCKDEGSVEPLLKCFYTIGPGAHVSEKESFVSFRALILATDSTELTRQTLSRHRVTQLLAPHVTENPIFFHATNVTDAGFKNAIDQMAEVGFEMLIFSFGSGFVLETNDTKYISKIKSQVDYAKSKGIEVGGYDLICLDRGHNGYGGNVGDQWVTVDEKTGALKADACFASGWYDKLHSLIDNFISKTGLAMLETDGPYGGGSCASTTHKHHHGFEDSIYKQTQLQNAFYHEMRRLNVYVNQPDNYFFQGGSRTGMGYDEQQYSLPRWRDLSISRAGMYDDLYSRLPTQGWMFVPLGDYHAGGDAATFQNHPQEYEFALAQYLGAGTAACYRGGELWDASDASGLVIKIKLIKWVNFYKKHRKTIIEPVVHLKRPDMQGWDGWLHVRPYSKDGEVGVAMLFNPTDSVMTVVVSLPLYYTGLDQQANVVVDEGKSVAMTLKRDYSIEIEIVMEAKSIHTVVISEVK